MPTVFYVVLAAILLTLFWGAFTFCMACLRFKEMPWFDERKLRRTPLRKYSQYIRDADAYLRGHNAHEVNITSRDGLKLSGTWLAADNPKGTIILAHGYRSSKYLDFSLVLAPYHDYGLNILLPDQRAHGKSQGRLITFGVKESDDVALWIDWHNAHNGELPIILSGLSMGASTVLFLADAELPKNVKGIIADCGFTSPWEIISCVYKKVIHLPPRASVWIADGFAKVFGGFSFRQKDTRKTLAHSRLPVLMVHGVDDGFVPCEMTRQGYAACTGEKQVLLVEGADHALSFLVDGERYKEMVLTFLDKNLERAV